MSQNHRGDPVTLNYASTDATGSPPLILKDSTGATRVLQSYECLIVTHLEANLVTAVVGADVFAVADNTTTGDVIIGSFGSAGASGAGSIAFTAILGPDGIGCPQGVTPKVVALNAGAITVVGTGYIQTDTTQVGRQNWNCRLQ